EVTMLIRSDRRWILPATVSELWSTITEVDHFMRWWPWLRRFEATELASGQVWSCSVSPPLPYTVDFELSIDRVVPEQSVSASLRGDIVGTSHIDVEPRAQGCSVRLLADLGPSSRSLSALCAVARPIVRFGHNWILDTAAQQFESRAL